jgi:hypothetical protein
MVSSDCSEARIEMKNLSSHYLRFYPNRYLPRLTQQKARNDSLLFLIGLDLANLLKDPLTPFMVNGVTPSHLIQRVNNL